jgi:hypothetical protein
MRPVVVQRKSSVLSTTFPWLETFFFFFSKRVFCRVRYLDGYIRGFAAFFFFSTDDIHRLG